MIKNFFGSCKDIMIKTVEKLKGSDKRVALARIAKEYGHGGKTFVAKEFKAGRDTIRLGGHELRTGITCVDAFSMGA